MDTSSKIYEDFINILDYIFYTYQYLSPTHILPISLLPISCQMHNSLSL